MHCSGGVHSSIVDTKSNLVNTIQCSAQYCSPPSLQYIYVCTRHNKTRALNKSRTDGNHGATGNTLLIRVLWFVKPVPLVDMNACVTVPLWTLDETPYESAKLDFDRQKGVLFQFLFNIFVDWSDGFDIAGCNHQVIIIKE